MNTMQAPTTHGPSATYQDALLSRRRQVKELHPEAIILCRVGDRWEAFGEDIAPVCSAIGTKMMVRHGEPLTAFPSRHLADCLCGIIRAGNRVCMFELRDNLKGSVQSGVFSSYVSANA